jgi:hypothetical protein
VIDWHRSPWHESPRALWAFEGSYEADVIPAGSAENEWVWIVRASASALTTGGDIVDVGLTDSTAGLKTQPGASARLRQLVEQGALEQVARGQGRAQSTWRLP